MEYKNEVKSRNETDEKSFEAENRKLSSQSVPDGT